MFFASDASAVHFSYRRYLENRLREQFGFDGTPIRLVFRDRTSVKLPRRKKLRSAPVASGKGPRRGTRRAGTQAELTHGLMAGPRVAVVGAGAWGTTLARRRRPDRSRSRCCATPRRRRHGSRETGRNEARLPGDRPAGRRSSRPPTRPRCATPPTWSIFAAPSAHLRTTVAARRAVPRPDADLLSVVKGLERGTLLRMSEVIAEAAGVPIGRVAALSGPNLAAEVARNLPASAVVAAADLELAERVVARLGAASVPALRQRGHPGRRAVRGAQERGRDRGRAPPTGSASATTARPAC